MLVYDHTTLGNLLLSFQQACFINGSNEQICDQQIEVALVGYIRGFQTQVTNLLIYVHFDLFAYFIFLYFKQFLMNYLQQNPLSDAQILDDDKSIAEACLDSVAYSYSGCSPAKL